MKSFFNIFYSLPEVLLYGLMVILIAGNVFLLTTIYSFAAHERTDTKTIEKQITCIADFFGHTNRASLTLQDLNVCQPVLGLIK